MQAHLACVAAERVMSPLRWLRHLPTDISGEIQACLRIWSPKIPWSALFDLLVQQVECWGMFLNFKTPEAKATTQSLEETLKEAQAHDWHRTGIFPATSKKHSGVSHSCSFRGD